MKIWMLHLDIYRLPSISATPQAQCLLLHSTHKHRCSSYHSEVTHVVLVSHSSNLTNLSPLSPTLNPYSRVFSSPIPLLTSHTHITHTLTSRRGRGPEIWLPHGKCYAAHLVYDMGNAMLAWPMVRFLPSDSGMFIVSLSPLGRGPCTHLNSRGHHYVSQIPLSVPSWYLRQA